MAVLHKKEEKIQAVLGRLPKKYTNEEFVAMFIKLYSKDWGKIKSAYIKQSQDKEPGTVINMPKPDLYLKQVLDTYLKNNIPAEIKEEPIISIKEVKAAKKKVAEEVTVAELKKVKAPAKKKEAAEILAAEPKTTAAVKKEKVTAKKKIVEEDVIAKPKKITTTKKAKEEKK